MKITRVLAPNPGPFTGTGTNTWLLEDSGRVAVIDPGPVEPGHEAAIIRALGDWAVEAVIVTHTHPDHAPLANPLASEVGGVPAFGYAPGPEFVPDVRLAAGDEVVVGETRLKVIETPGHSADHLCFLAGKALFTGDHIIGGSSVLIEDVGAYVRSLGAVRHLDLDALYPGHGEVMKAPYEVIEWNLAHRLQRESEILQAVKSGASTPTEVLERVYSTTEASLLPLAARNVEAHLRKLADEGWVTYVGGRVEARR